ncbi:hypothetical protein GCK72_004598 [Caenorhabditis remanei]|uniref:3'-5' exonuclease domain-containing protein n=1 Tax=Caenorhabditis remanei TaxID=31234 RepID=A0A6A5HC87_CAERE|nr:hypothetical protein GCK72_004598 [Caenorhabditis remanei]KAF1764649.1 hypothetical protein GCK72_004598 [Caenorhabditis remanei]
MGGHASGIHERGQIRQQRTLRAHAHDIEFNLRKCETMSNWASAELREDQLQYAAMDSVVLHYLNIGAALNWSYGKSAAPNSRDHETSSFLHVEFPHVLKVHTPRRSSSSLLSHTSPLQYAPLHHRPHTSPSFLTARLYSPTRLHSPQQPIPFMIFLLKYSIPL